MRKCPRCKKVLPDSYFTQTTPYCKICRRDYDWQYRYGITPEEYLEMWTAQDGKCLICGRELPDGEYLAIDHDKQTGEIRGLLCRKCNLGLGNFQDNPNILMKAATYLKEINNEQ